MSREHVGTTFGLIVTSGKLDIWPLVAPENQGFVKLRKFARREKYLGTRGETMGESDWGVFIVPFLKSGNKNNPPNYRIGHD